LERTNGSPIQAKSAISKLPSYNQVKKIVGVRTAGSRRMPALASWAWSRTPSAFRRSSPVKVDQRSRSGLPSLA
jgi:hypothetical protein